MKQIGRKQTTLNALTHTINMMETHDIMTISCNDYFITMLKEARDLIKEKTSKAELEGGGYNWWHVCGECHGAINENDNYCKHCGAKVDWT